MSEPKSSRWWENYVVRYFVGTVFGAGIVVFLHEYSTSPFRGVLSSVADVRQVTFKDITVFGSIGFAFCYVASSPILILHALREHLRLGRLREHAWRWPVAFLLGGAIVWALSTFGFSAPSMTSYIVSIALVAVVGLQLVLIFTTVLDRFSAVREFYIGLSAARSSEAKRAAEYVESYRHLREHGNAFSILLLEAILGFILANMPSPYAAVVVLATWVLPASCSWLVGAALESRFAHEPPLTKSDG